MSNYAGTDVVFIKRLKNDTKMIAFTLFIIVGPKYCKFKKANFNIIQFLNL